jgi:hypothetical protein
MNPSPHSHQSTYREALLEHLFVGAILQNLWMRGPIAVEVLKPQVDDAGYDIVMEANKITRHIQLKSSFNKAKTSFQKIHIKLGEKPSGCVIWMRFDPETLEIGPFLWFGSNPGDKLPSLMQLKVAKHAKGDAEGIKADRPNIRKVQKRNFIPIKSIEELVDILFGKGTTNEA